MKALVFGIHLIEPVLVTRIGGGDPNSAVSFEFIPGSAIRGATVSRYLGGKPGDATDVQFRHFFLDGSVCFLNAYPQSQTGGRTLPTPLSWRVEKDEKEPIFDLAVKQEANSEKKLRAVEKPFCRLWQGKDGKAEVELYQPVAQVNIHNARENRQSVTKEGSTVFRYHALADGQNFIGAVTSSNESDLEKLAHLLLDEGSLYIGGSHLAGYGRVQVESTQILNDWAEYESAGVNSGSVVVTLLSDALVRDPGTGAYIASVEPALGLTHRLAFVRSRVVAGFNRTWNLPLPQALAIEAGSVFVYDFAPQLLEGLRVLVETGIGARRIDGFGRIAVNWHRTAEITVRKPVSSTPSVIVLEGNSALLARRTVERMLLAELDQALVRAVNKLGIGGKPRNAQLSRIRVIARRALAEKNGGILLKHLEDMKRTASEQFQRARIAEQSLGEWLKSRLENVESIWTLLDIELDRLPSVGGLKPKLTPTLALTYTLRLIDNVMRKALREINSE